MAKRIFSMSPSKTSRVNVSSLKVEESTPPCTPSPSYGDAKILVQPHSDSRHLPNIAGNSSTTKSYDESHSFSDDCDNSTISDLSATQYTFNSKSVSTDLNYAKDGSRRNDQSFPLNDAGTLFDTVMGPCVSECIARVGLGEPRTEESTQTSTLWGMSPSYSSLDDETPYFEENPHREDDNNNHEDIELVYQPQTQSEEAPLDSMYCQPCVEDVQKNKKTSNETKPILKRSILRKKPMKKTEFNSSNGKPQSIASKEGKINTAVKQKIQIVEPSDVDSNPKSAGNPQKEDSTSNKFAPLASSNKQIVDDSSLKDHNKTIKPILKKKADSLEVKTEENRKECKNSDTRKTKKTVSLRVSQAFIKLTRKKNKNSKKNKGKEQRPGEKRGRWKVAQDPQTKKTYFYHSKTKEVSWEKPLGFNEWKAILDKQSNKHYYYNRITKENTWNRPSEFEEWRAIRDPNFKNRVYYYNVLTKERRWKEPKEYKQQQRSLEVKNDKKAKETSTHAFRKPIPKGPTTQKITKCEQNLSNEPVASSSANEEVGKNESNGLHHESPNNDQTYNENRDNDQNEILGIIDSVTKTGTKEPNNTTPSVSPSANLNSKQLHLSKILATYNPDEPTINSTFVREVTVGKEEKIIDELEGIIEETPIDGVPAAVRRFMLKHGSDQHLNDDDAEIPEPVSLTRTISLKTVKTIASHKTNFSTVSMSSRVKSNMTETTNKVNNTSSRHVFHPKMNQSTIPSMEEKMDEDDLSQSTPTSLTSADFSLTPQKPKLQFYNIPNVIKESDETESQHDEPQNELEDKKLKFSAGRDQAVTPQNVSSQILDANDARTGYSKNALLDYDSSYAGDEDNTIDDGTRSDIDFKSSKTGNLNIGDNRKSKNVRSNRQNDKTSLQASSVKQAEVKETSDRNITKLNRSRHSPTFTKSKEENISNRNKISERKDDYLKSREIDTNSGHLNLTKRFGARSLAQYNEDEESSNEDVSTGSWDDNTVSSDSEFSYDFSVGSADTYGDDDNKI